MDHFLADVQQYLVSLFDVLVYFVGEGLVDFTHLHAQLYEFLVIEVKYRLLLQILHRVRQIIIIGLSLQILVALVLFRQSLVLPSVARGVCRTHQNRGLGLADLVVVGEGILGLWVAPHLLHAYLLLPPPRRFLARDGGREGLRIRVRDSVHEVIILGFQNVGQFVG